MLAARVTSDKRSAQRTPAEMRELQRLFKSPAARAIIAKDRRTKAAIGELTQAEKRVFRLMLRGLSAKAIGKALGISSFTVSNHTRKIFDAFRLKSRSSLIALFVIMPPEEWFT